jgi:hypothetical protein
LATPLVPLCLGDRHRKVNGVFEFQISLDAKLFGAAIQISRLREREKRTQTILSDFDFFSNSHPADSAFFTSGPKIREIKRIHALLAINRISGLAVGLNEYSRLHQNDRLVRGGRAAEQPMPSEYENKAKTADETFGAPGSKAVRGALRAMPKVRGIAMGALGEFSESVNLLVEGPSH